MRERGIHFNSEMVRAVMEGRKVQTRRIMKVQPESHQFGLLRITDSTKRGDIGKYHWAESNATGVHTRSALFSCPFGAVGDRLWVRETWQCTSFETNEYGHVEGVDYMRQISVIKPNSPAWGVSYKANGFDTDDAEERGFPWRPSIHMPRWASRITLEITGVRVERLQAVSEADAQAEGVQLLSGGFWRHYQPNEWTQFQLSARGSFATLWNFIYGDGSFQANPWVWVIEFKRVEGE